MTNIGVLIWPNAEVLDFCGPFEAFNNVRKLSDHDVNVFTVSHTKESVDAQGLSINPTFSFNNCPVLDIMIIPGGNSSWIIEQQEYLDFVASNFKHNQDQIMLTVCTGALVPAKIGLLTQGMDATTHQVGMETLRDLAPEVNVLSDVRFTDNNNIIMSGGISAGLDSSLYLIEKLWGSELAQEIATYMEYDWQINAPNLKANY